MYERKTKTKQRLQSSRVLCAHFLHTGQSQGMTDSDRKKRQNVTPPQSISSKIKNHGRKTEKYGHGGFAMIPLSTSLTRGLRSFAVFVLKVHTFASASAHCSALGSHMSKFTTSQIPQSAEEHCKVCAHPRTDCTEASCKGTTRPGLGWHVTQTHAASKSCTRNEDDNDLQAQNAGGNCARS